MSDTTFLTTNLSFAYPGRPAPALNDLGMAVASGTVHAVLGPNGSGKSTLLRLLLGALRPTGGAVEYRGHAIHEWSRRGLAQRVGVVPQLEPITFPLTVRELVAMGRYPHLGPWRSERAADRAAVDAAMQRCDVAPMATRRLDTLSGGELQRARVARALAQEPETLVLDEPTASLDIHHEMAMFELLARLATDDGTTVVIATHNMNLASRYAGGVLLLDEGRQAAAGSPESVFNEEVLRRVYRWPVAVVPHPGPGADAGAPQIVPLAWPSGGAD